MSICLEVAEREPAVAGTCGTCGRPLTQVGPRDECLRCLVSLGFLSDSQRPEESETSRRLTPGPLKYDHFEVEVGADGFPIELGAGAITITYRARDTVLNSVVALKVIDRSVAQDPRARSRFLREARAAAQIRHPNVARVSHYGEQDGECFYVMELVEGETLETRVRCLLCHGVGRRRNQKSWICLRIFITFRSLCPAHCSAQERQRTAAIQETRRS